jgi:tryptophan synthase alpha subunit
MGYYNPILAYGVEQFITQAARVGVNGLIIVDLPPEESKAVKKNCAENDLDLVMLLTPTSTDERIKRVTAEATGFIYCVSVTGVTGARSSLPTTLPALVRRIRTHTDLPIAVGFGISQREHIESLTQYADGAVIGSAIIDAIDQTISTERVAKIQQFVKALSPRQQGENDPRE